MSDTVLLKRDGPVAVLTLNRPKAFNAMNDELVVAFTARLHECTMDTDVRALVITGEGKAFCAGGDLAWMQGFPGGTGAAVHTLASKLHQAIIEIRRMPNPVIAAINGVAAGAGFSLALACDFRIMAESAQLRQAYTSAGLSIDGGGTFALARLLGHARALEIAAFDKPITAQRALEWGLVTEVVDDTMDLAEAIALGKNLAQRSVHAFGVTKELLLDAWDTPLERQLEKERIGIRNCAMHPDGQEGIAAFTEKRKPEFDKS